MHRTDVDQWLAAYGRAWEHQDAQAFAGLFTRDVHYHWTPFDQPKVGRAAVAEAFAAAVGRQSQIQFAASVLAASTGSSIAHWRCSFERAGEGYTVELDGIFVMEFTETGLCKVFREWWHSNEG